MNENAKKVLEVFDKHVSKPVDDKVEYHGSEPVVVMTIHEWCAETGLGPDEFREAAWHLDNEETHTVEETPSGTITIKKRA